MKKIFFNLSSVDSEGKNPVKNNEAVGDILSAESRQRMEIPTVVEQLISERDESAGSRQSKKILISMLNRL